MDATEKQVVNLVVGDIMTGPQTIRYLQLDEDASGDNEEAKAANSRERLRNLERRQQLPVFKRGRLKRYSRTQIDAWLRGEKMPKRK